MTRRTVCITTSIASCLLGFLLASFPLGAAEPGALKPNAQDKCPACGMFVAKYPDWTTAVLFKDGSKVFFDGAKDMFKYLLDPQRYDSARRSEGITAIMVKKYYGLSWIDARKAWYVLGSDVYGPMSRELIARDGSRCQGVHEYHKGREILKFSDVTAEVMKTID